MHLMLLEHPKHPALANMQARDDPLDTTICPQCAVESRNIANPSSCSSPLLSQ